MSNFWRRVLRALARERTVYMKDGDIADHIEALAQAVRAEAWIAARPGQLDRLADIAETMDALAKDVREG